MENSLLKLDHKVMQEWKNYVLMPNHMIVITQKHKVVQGFDNVVLTYTQNQQMSHRLYDRGITWKSILSSVRKTVRRVDVL